MRSSLLASLVIALVVGCSARDERVSHLASAIVGGTADTAHASVAYVMTTATATFPELCTGTLIAPKIVLTAGHCTLGQDASTLIVGFASATQFASGTVNVASVVTYPAFGGSAGDVQGGLDLGLVFLADDATVTPVPIDHGDAGALVGKSLVAVGYGYSDPASQDSSGTRRSAKVTVNGACSALLSFGDATTNACHGDSGGPLLATAADGSESIVGVVSFGDEVHCAASSYAVRVDRFLGWLDPYITESASTCSGCPNAATDCEALEAGDAGPPAKGDAGPARPPPGPAPSSSGGGCALARPNRSSEGAGALVLAALALVLARRAQKRAVSVETKPPGRD